MITDKSTISDTQVLKSMEWTKGLSRAGLTNMLFMPHFGRSVQVNAYVKQLLFYFHRRCLWLDHPYPINVELISRITSLQKEGDDPAPFLAKQDINPIKWKHNLQQVG